MRGNIYLKLGVCTLVSALLGLTSHIYLSAWTKPLIEHMLKNFHPESSSYTPPILFAAYGTSFITFGVIVLIYHHAGHLMAFSNRFLKALFVGCVILEIKGAFFRGPVMDYLYNVSLGLETPLAFVCLTYADKWVANLLLALCLVCLCPLKHASASTP